MGREEKGTFDKQPLALVVGPQVSRVNIKVFGQLSAIRVDFLPGAMHRLLGTPMNELFDGGFDALDFFGAEVNQVIEQLRNIANMDAGKNIVEKFLLKKVMHLRNKLPFDSAMYLLLKRDGTMSIEETASLACLSVKQFERKCKERIGMSPKIYARILRFSKAYRLHEAFPQLSWTNIAYEANYFDHMHMIRDFKAFAGVNPSAIAQQLLSTPLRMQKDLSY